MNPAYTRPKKLIIKSILFIPGFFVVLLVIAVIPIFLFLTLLGIIIGNNLALTGTMKMIPAAIGLVAIISLCSAIKALFDLFRRGRIIMEEAILIDLKEEPELKKLITSLTYSRHLKSRLPNTVILHFYPDVFVTKYYRKLYKGKAKGRILAIGLPIISTLSISELSAVLAHELAHFSGQEVFYLSFIDRFLKGLKSANMITARFDDFYQYKSLTDMMLKFFISGIITFWNIVVLCIRTPNFVLHRYISLWESTILDFSRSGEIRADCIAAAICGRQNFADGLTKVIGCGAAFSLYLEKYLKPLLSCDKYPKNVFREFRRLNLIKSVHVSDYIEYKLSEESSKYDVHPSLSERIEITSNVFEGSNLDSQDTSAPAYTLLLHLEKYEEMATLEHIKSRLKANDTFDFSSLKVPSSKKTKKITSWESYSPPFSWVERRFWALIFDLSLILFLFVAVAIIQTVVIMLVFYYSPESNLSTAHALATFFLIELIMELFVITWLYSASFESSRWQSTPGKRFFQICVENEDGQRISFFSATIRFIFKVFFPILLPINLLLAIFGNRSLHNILSGAWVELKWDD